MRFLVQRVKEASVTVEDKVMGKIGKGFLVFVGISNWDFESTDTLMEKKLENAYDIADKMVRKLIGLRIFEDENGKTNLDMKSVEGQLLIISQFTLYADCRKGNRPSFVNAGDPEMAEKTYNYIVEKCRKEMDETCLGEKVQEGVFGAEMEVSLINDGPFTILLDSSDICR